VNDLFSAAPITGLAPRQVGFRLFRLEMLNWGTFDGRVWALDLNGDNTLLTGDIGSGKSTLVDAITTLLVPYGKINYNKAAGAEHKERSLRSYVLGQYKTEKGEAGLSAKPVTLRDANTYTVLLAHFRNEALGQDVTLAQVFWLRDPAASPVRFHVIADRVLSIRDHFTAFGGDIPALKKRLSAEPGVELDEAQGVYIAAFRRRFGINSDQALELFHQTVSMKAVGNLTSFVRQHMLEPGDAQSRITALLTHFDNLTRAHDAVRIARDQRDRLIPLVENCDRHHAEGEQGALLEDSRNALHPYFARLKAELLEARVKTLTAEIETLTGKVADLERLKKDQGRERDDLLKAIHSNGGGRLDQLQRDRAMHEKDHKTRKDRADRYAALIGTLGLPAATDSATFLANRTKADAERARLAAAQADAQNAQVEAGVELREIKAEHDEVAAEVESLRRRRSNIPRHMLELRQALCAAVGRDEDDLPFIGELLQVRPDDSVWEGAAERLLHAFGLSLLVPDEVYGAVAAWVDRTHLSQRLVYYRVQPITLPVRTTDPQALCRKLDVKPDRRWSGWLTREMAERFGHVCCSTLDEFRRQPKAITLKGQIKGGNERHEKDDRHRIDDRSRYVLGWSNSAKIAALDGHVEALKARIQDKGDRFAQAQKQASAATSRLQDLSRLDEYASFEDIDWRSAVTAIQSCTEEIRRIEEGSDVLRTLRETLTRLEGTQATTELKWQGSRDKLTKAKDRCDTAARALEQAERDAATADDALKARCWPTLDAARAEHSSGALTVESCDRTEQDIRKTLQDRIDAARKRQTALGERIISAMSEFRQTYPSQTTEIDASLDAADEYRRLLARLKADDLPRFEDRFKRLLNEETINEVANFQSQLNRERDTITDRIEIINDSLHGIDYNDGRYIALVAEPSIDADVRDFRQSLRACTENTLTGSDDDGYSEAKFLQVQDILQRFRGRDGSAEHDRRWTEKVTDVRNWFTFSASERWREDGREHEHYPDSGGKSGGQKEKLAYTVLAASLAYQFGLDATAAPSRSFRFVVIDEAFGRGSDESARYGLELFKTLNLQLLVITPLQKIHIIEPYVAAVGYVHNPDGSRSLLRTMTIEELRAEREASRSS